MKLNLKHRLHLPRLAAALVVAGLLAGPAYSQAPSIGVSGAAGNKFRDAMGQQNPEEKLRLLREAEPLFTDPVTKYSVLYPDLIDAYVKVNDLADAAKVVDEMSKAGVQESTEADSRLLLANAYINSKQYDPALQQLNATIARLKAANGKAAATNKVQQDLAESLALEGKCLLETGSAAKAIESLRESEELRKSRQLDPSASTALDIARCYVALGEPDDALQKFGEAYSHAAHRVNAIQNHFRVTGQTSSADLAHELSQQQTVLSLVEQEARPVYGSRDAQLPFETYLHEKLDGYDKQLITEAMSKSKSDKPAPDFSLSSVAGAKKKLSDLRGQVVLLNFWDTACKPCRAEYPHLQKLQDDFKARGLSVLMINLDDELANVKPFAEKYGFLGSVLLKGDSIQHAYGIGPIPHTVIIDRSGTIRYDEVGFTLDTPAVFRAEITTLLPKSN